MCVCVCVCVCIRDGAKCVLQLGMGQAVCVFWERARCVCVTQRNGARCVYFGGGKGQGACLGGDEVCVCVWGGDEVCVCVCVWEGVKCMCIRICIRGT